MAPKKIVPKGTDDIIELTDIVEQGVLPAETANVSMSDASFEDELDSMLADVPELSAAKKELGDAPAPGAFEPAVSLGEDDDELADLDSLLEELGEDLPGAKPPAPKFSPAEPMPVEDVLLDVDDLLAEAGASDQTEFMPADPVAEAATEADAAAVDDFLAEFADMDAELSSAETTASPVEESIDASFVGADELLAELQSATEPDTTEDDLLAELKSVMGGDIVDETSSPEAATPEVSVEEAIMAEVPLAAVVLPQADLPEIPMPEPVVAEDPAAEIVASEAAILEDEVSADDILEELNAPAAPAASVVTDDELMAMAAVADAEASALPAEPAALDNGDDFMGPEDLQQLDALLNDILQPGAAAPSPVEPGLDAEAALAAAEPDFAPEIEPSTAAEPAVAAPVMNAAALTAELLDEDGPLFTAVRSLVQQELESRMAALEERLTQNLDKAAAQSAAKIIREEIAALAQDLLE